jgi:hypothetical protein
MRSSGAHQRAMADGGEVRLVITAAQVLRIFAVKVRLCLDVPAGQFGSSVSSQLNAASQNTMGAIPSQLVPKTARAPVHRQDALDSRPTAQEFTSRLGLTSIYPADNRSSLYLMTRRRYGHGTDLTALTGHVTVAYSPVTISRSGKHFAEPPGVDVIDEPPDGNVRRDPRM